MDEKRKEEVGYPSHDWEVLLSRFSRKRMRCNSLYVSGAGRDKIAQAENSLEEYLFFQWYIAFIQQKNPKVIFLRCRLLQKISNLNYLKTRKTVQEVNTRKTAKTNTLLWKEPILRQKKLSPSDAGIQSSCSRSKHMANIDVLSEITSFLKFKQNKLTPVDLADNLFGKMVAA